MKSGKIFELEVRELLDAALPASTLSGVCLFQPDQFTENKELGVEIDHVVHFVAGSTDHLLLIECKAPSVKFRGSNTNMAAQEWIVEQPRTKYLKSQLFTQAQALLQNLYPRENVTTLHIHGLALSSDPATPALSQKSPTQDRLTYHLRSASALANLLKTPVSIAALLGVEPESFRVLRVQQSDILRKVRHGLVVPELGHPEVPNGMRYVARCRETLDCELTKLFQPTKEARWAINGAAGMGKTVLLAYAATVFASGRVIKETRADRQVSRRELVEWDNLSVESSLPPLGRRKVVLIGLNPKQCSVLQRECERFLSEYKKLADRSDDPAMANFSRPPVVERWNDSQALDADVLLIDEAHDLSPAAQAKIRTWWEKGAGKRYLILACDRHQKLRLVGSDATILEGISFSGCSTRLTRNYRSPSPVYGAALALMFRWFGKGGTKVIPAQRDLIDSFGFVFDTSSPFPNQVGGQVHLNLRNDCHPANYWSFTVARYTEWQVAYRWIEEWGLQDEQALWVRFAHTDHDIEQKQLPRVHLLDLLVHDPDRVIDTHIKGREYPVVIIEGLPDDGTDETNLNAMLLWRRRLYLCASRATCFLFFVYPRPDGSPVMAAWDAELNALIASCSVPINPMEGSSKFWRLSFDFPERLLRPDVFAEMDPAPAKANPPELPTEVPQPASVLPVIAEAAPTPHTLPQVDIPKVSRPEPAPVVSPGAGSNRPAELPASAPALSAGSTLTAPLCPPPPPTKEPAQPPVADIAKTLATKAPAPAQPELLSKKEFQRLYGQQRGWPAFYDHYLNTGVIPPQLLNLTATKAATPQPISQPVLPQAAKPAPVVPKPHHVAQVSAPAKAGQPTPPRTKQATDFSLVTPRMVALHLKKPLYSALSLTHQAGLSLGFNESLWINVNSPIPQKTLKLMYSRMGLPLPTEAEFLELKRKADSAAGALTP
jgi:hypothetical protein